MAKVWIELGSFFLNPNLSQPGMFPTFAYLGMMKMERHVRRKIIEGPTLRMPASHPSTGGTSYEVEGTPTESLLITTKDKRLAGLASQGHGCAHCSCKESRRRAMVGRGGAKGRSPKDMARRASSPDEKLKESLDQKGGRMAKGAPAREK